MQKAYDSNLKNLLTELGIRIDLPTFKIKNLLKKRLKQIHPDKNGGNFRSANEKEEFERINDVLKLLNSDLKPTVQLESEKALNPAVTTDDLAKILSEKEKLPTEREVRAAFENMLKSFAATQAKRLIVPKVTLTSITAVLTFVWAFPNLLMQNPIIGKFFTSTSFFLAFSIIWISSLLVTVVFWVMAYTKEKLVSRAIQIMQKDKYIDDIFQQVLENLFNRHGDWKNREQTSFTISEVENTLIELKSYYALLDKFYERSGFGIPQKDNDELTEIVADYFIERALQNGVIVRVPKTINNQYKIVVDLAKREIVKSKK